MYIPDAIPAEDRETMLERGYGSRIGIGDSFAVMVVDMTKEFVEAGYDNGNPEVGKPCARNIARLMEVATEHGIRGYYSRQAHGRLPVEYGRWGDSTAQERTELDDEARELADELSPTENDVVFLKFKPSVFFDSQLLSMLIYDGIDTLIVTGMATSGCIRATVIDAFSYNYRVVIPEECVADSSGISQQVHLWEMDMKYADVLPLDEVIGLIEGTAEPHLAE